MTLFEKTYNKLFRTRGVDTSHISDCELVWEAATKAERERIAAWLQTQRNDVPATGEEFAAAVRALG